VKYAIPAVIFAGGKSSRMGQDKALLPFGNSASLSEFQYKRLNALFEKVYLSAKAYKFDFECDLIEDRYEEHSPMAALISIFEALDNEAVFVLSVDAPFVDKGVIDTLIQHYTSDNDIIVAKSPKGIEPLCAVYKRSILSTALDQMKRGNHRLTDLLKDVRCKEILFETEQPFTNLNHPEEYERALGLFV